MTDKIIVDGVDVSRCGFPDKYGYCRCYHTDLGKTPDEFKNIKCKDNPNCYYKQLKRKEKECEKLKKEIQNNSLKTCPLCGEGFLSPEGAKLREQLQAEKEKSKHLEDCLNQALKDFEVELDKAVKYKQILEEIKSLLKISIDATNAYEHFDAVDKAFEKFSEMRNDV